MSKERKVMKWKVVVSDGMKKLPKFIPLNEKIATAKYLETLDRQILPWTQRMKSAHKYMPSSRIASLVLLSKKKTQNFLKLSIMTI